jgi:hypothetical protein
VVNSTSAEDRLTAVFRVGSFPCRGASKAGQIL